MSAPSVVMRTVNPDGTLDQYLPDPQGLDISSVFSDCGTISLKYPSYGINFDLLKDDVELAVIVDGVEYLPMRSKIEQIEGDDASEDGGSGTAFLWTFTCRTLAGRLQEAVVYPSLWTITPVLPDPAQIEFTSATPGAILITLFETAQSRGALQWLSWNFTSTHDSNGVAWGSTFDIQFSIGTDYYTAVMDLVQANGMDFKFMGRQMNAFKVGTLSVDRTVTNPPLIFTKGRDMEESPRKLSTRDLSTAILVTGDNNIFTERISDSSFLDLWGRRESYQSLDNITTVASLEEYGDELLATANVELQEITHSLYFQVDENPQPVRDFEVGDWAWSDVGNGLERHRIIQWVFSLDQQDNSDNFEGSVTLNDLVDEQLTKLNNRINAIQNGSTGVGASGTVDDGKNPATPTGIVLSSTAYLDVTAAKAILDIVWDPVITNSDGSVCSDIQGYNIRWQYTTDSFWRQSVSVGSDQNTISFDGLMPNSGVNVQIQAGNTWGRVGAWSAGVEETTAGDTVPPNQPSSPTVVSVVGTLRVQWDGLDHTETPLAADCTGVQVHVSSVGGSFTPTSATQMDFLPPGSPIATTLTTSQGLTYGTQYWVKLIAVDTSGNVSTPSATTLTSTAILVQLIQVEIGTGQVGLANTTFSDVGNLADDGSFENATVRGTRSISSAGTHFSWDNTTSSNGTWSLRHDWFAAGATIERMLIQGALPVKPGERVFGACDYRYTSDNPIGSAVTLSIKWIDKSGNYLDNTGAINNVHYDLSTNADVAADNAWHERVANVSQQAPPNVTTMEIWAFTANRTAGTIWMDAVEIRRQIDTLLIGTAAITTALIANLAVNDAQIGTVSAGKITVGTLSADMVVGSRIKTADTGARAEMNSGGFGAWDSSGNQTFEVAASTGYVAIIGTLSSGSGSKKVVINPDDSGVLPEIRWYPTSSGTNYGFINAVDSGDGTQAYLGVNSGQFSSLSETSSQRLYMWNSAMQLEYIRTDTQNQWGSGLYLDNNGIYLDITTTAQSGYLEIFTNQVSIGYNGSTADDAAMNFYNNGNISFTGNFNNYVSANSNDATFTGLVGTGTGVSGTSFGYGATMLGGLGCGGTLVRSAGVTSCCVTAANSTGFTAAYGAATTGTFVIWTYRVA